MNMIDDGNDQDQDMKDKLLQGLIEQMEAILGGGMKQRSGMGVQVQAADPDSLKAGLEQAKGAVDDQKFAEGGAVLDDAPDTRVEDHAEGSPDDGAGDITLDRTGHEMFGEGGEASDLSRLEELMGHEDEEEEKKKGRK